MQLYADKYVDKTDVLYVLVEYRGYIAVKTSVIVTCNVNVTYFERNVAGWDTWSISCVFPYIASY